MVLWTRSYCSLNTVNSQKEKLVSFYEMNVPEEVEKNINFIHLSPGMSTFLIFCDNMQSTHKAIMYQSVMVVSEKNTSVIIWVAS